MTRVNERFSCAGVERRARRGELRLCDGRVGFELLGFLARRRVLREQPLCAIAVRARELELRARAVALGREAVDLGLERPRIYLEEQIALRDARAFGESDGLDVAAHARPHRDVLDRFEPAREVGPIAELVGRDDRGGDGGGRRRGRRVAGFAPPQPDTAAALTKIEEKRIPVLVFIGICPYRGGVGAVKLCRGLPIASARYW